MTMASFSRRHMLQRMGTGMGVLGLSSLLQDQGQLAQAAGNPLATKKSHFAPKAKHIIHLFMNGGPSQVDTFDPKPALTKHHGERPPTTAGLGTERRTGSLMGSPFRFRKA